MIFVSSPYSNPDKEVRKQRVDLVSRFAAKLVSKGHHVFSPIAYGVYLIGFQEMPDDWTFWKNFCEAYLKKSDELWVLKLEGWDRSEGVSAEIRFAQENNIPIKYIDL